MITNRKSIFPCDGPLASFDHLIVSRACQADKDTRVGKTKVGLDTKCVDWSFGFGLVALERLVIGYEVMERRKRDVNEKKEKSNGTRFLQFNYL